MKRPIDVIRENAGSASIGIEHGTIIRALDFDDRLLLIAQNGIVSAKLADQIDPMRTNIDVPFAVQKVELHRGSTSPLVAWTFLTAIELFQPLHLPDGFPDKEAIRRSFDVATWLSEIQDFADELKRFHHEVENGLVTGLINPSKLPSFRNLRGSTEHVINLARKAAVEVMWLTNVFYPKSSKKEIWYKGLISQLDGMESDRATGVAEVRALIDLIETVNNFRNACVHADKEKSVLVSDYELTPDLQIRAPTLSIRHPACSLPQENLLLFVEALASRMAIVYESMAANLLALNVKSFGPFLTYVVSLDEGQYRDGVRFALHTSIPDGLVGRQSK